jgi:hypothetical protein
VNRCEDNRDLVFFFFFLIMAIELRASCKCSIAGVTAPALLLSVCFGDRFSLTLFRLALDCGFLLPSPPQ